MKRSARLLKIISVVVRYRLYDFLPFVSQYRSPSAANLRQALEELGPIFVKFGQILSTRRDLLPDDLAQELAKLQDDVPPFSNQTAVRVIEKSLKAKTAELFADFSEQPLASASIAQVHAATLHSGEEVVVKVLRPKIKKIIARDLALMYSIAKWTQRLWAQGKRLRPVEVVQEFEQSILDELDLLREAGNASLLGRNFKNSRQLTIPKIYWPYCRQQVLVMERIYGVPITDLEQLRAKDTNLKQLAEYGVEIFFTQVFRDCFFHADMHAGNIFADISDPHDPRYIAVDFGIVGTLSPEDQHYLATNLLAFFHRDYRRVATLHIESGWVPKHTKVGDFEAAIRTVCEPIFERPIKEISFGHLLLRLFQTAQRFEMTVQPQLLLLQKTLLNIEGLGRQLYPELNLWETGKPFLERWMKQRIGWRAFYDQAKDEGPRWLAGLADLPNQVLKLPQVQQQQLALQQQQQSALAELTTTVKRQQRWFSAITILFAAGLATLLLRQGLPWPW